MFIFDLYQKLLEMDDPQGEYIVMKASDLERIRDTARETGVYEEFKALDISVTPFEVPRKSLEGYLGIRREEYLEYLKTQKEDEE